MSALSAGVVEREYVLTPNSELRVQLPCDRTNASLTISLQQNTTVESADPKHNTNSCEINGSELVPGVPYTFEGGSGIGLFSNTGCTLRVRGPARVVREVYTTTSTNTRLSIRDLHLQLNQKRGQARDAEKDGSENLGPRVLVVGTESVGKTAVAHTLVNYAARTGYRPLFLDLDSIRVNECATLSCVDAPFDPTDGPQFIPHLSYFFGDRDIAANWALLKHCLATVMTDVEQRCGRYRRTRLGGLVIDCPPLPIGDDSAQGPTSTGAQADSSLEFIHHIIVECGIDYVVTVGSDRLRNQIRRHCQVKVFEAKGGSLAVGGNSAASGISSWLPQDMQDMMDEDAPAKKVPEKAQFLKDLANSEVTTATTVSGHLIRLVSIDPLGGSVRWFPEERVYRWYNSWFRYFFGPPSAGLTPTPIDIQWQEHKFVQLSAVETSALAGLLPLDSDDAQTSQAHVTSFSDIDITAAKFTNKILAVSPVSLLSPSGERLGELAVEEALKKGIVVGFVWVIAVQEHTKTMKLLSPSPSLPTKGGTCFYVCRESTLQKSLLMKR